MSPCILRILIEKLFSVCPYGRAGSKIRCLLLGPPLVTSEPPIAWRKPPANDFTYSVNSHPFRGVAFKGDASNLQDALAMPSDIQPRRASECVSGFLDRNFRNFSNKSRVPRLPSGGPLLPPAASCSLLLPWLPLPLHDAIQNMPYYSLASAGSNRAHFAILSCAPSQRSHSSYWICKMNCLTMPWPVLHS